MIVNRRRYGRYGDVWSDIVGFIPSIIGGGTAPAPPPPVAAPKTSPLVYVALGVGGLAVVGGLYSVLKR